MIKIDKASCLCLDKRWMERYEDIRDISLRLDCDFEFFLAGDGKTLDANYDYIDEPDPDVSRWGYGRQGFKHHHWNAFHCHKEMIRRAKAEGRENLLMLEDDAYMTDRFEKIWKHISAFNPKYDLLYLGWWISDENDEFNKNIEKNWDDRGIIEIDVVRQVGGLHGVLVRNTMFDYILNLPANNPIDYQLNRCHDQFDSLYIRPKIIHTRTTYSMCEGSVITRNAL